MAPSPFIARRALPLPAALLLAVTLLAAPGWAQGEPSPGEETAREKAPPKPAATPAAASSSGAAIELITDRPDQTESTAIVPRGFVQIETGWVFSRSRDDGLRADAHEFPGTLARIGLVRWAELRLGWGGYLHETVREGPLRATSSGGSDAEIGLKLLLREEGETTPLPSIALIAHTSLPVGSDGISTERADPSVRLALANTLSDRFSLGYNLGMEWETTGPSGSRATLSRYIYTLALGVGMTERLGMFLEVFGDVAGSAPGRPAHNFDGGFTYLLRHNVQLDFSAGAGLSSAAPDWFLGAGISFRLPD